MNYPYYPQYGMQQAPSAFQQARPQFVAEQAIGMKGRPVSSIEEARAASIDFDGSIFYFPDIANKRIYTKQINMDGTSTLNVYEYKNIPTEQVINPSQYVTREEFETSLNQLKGMLQQRKEEPTPQGTTSSPAAPPQFEF